MKKFSGWILSLALGLTAFSPGLADHTARSSSSVRPVVADESLALLPQSDAVAIVDADRLFNDVLPKIKSAWPQQSEKPIRELDEFISRTGVDPRKVKTIALGLSQSGKNTAAVMILDGLALDSAKLEALLKEAKAEKADTISYKGKTIYVTRPAKKPAGGNGQREEAKNNPQSNVPGSILNTIISETGLKTDEVAFAQLDSQRLVAGDQNQIRKVIDAATGLNSPGSGLSSELMSALKETSPTGVIRFALSVPENLRQQLAGQDYFKDLAAVQMVAGTVEVSDDLSLLLDARLRTLTNAEASKIETSLNGLVAVGKMMLGGNEEPLMQAVMQLLTEIKIGAQTNHVSLALKVPRALFDQALKPAPKKAESKPEK
jgi:hypothetical protein